MLKDQLLNDQSPGCIATWVGARRCHWSRPRSRDRASSTLSAKPARRGRDTQTGRSSDVPATRCCAAGRSRDTRRSAPIGQSSHSKIKKNDYNNLF